MKALVFILLTLIFYSTSFAQTACDYKTLTLLLKTYPKTKTAKLYFITFLPEKISENTPKEDAEIYVSSANELIQKNIPSSNYKLTKRTLRRSHIKWNKDKVVLANSIDKETDDPFFYYSKPIFVTNVYFITISYYVMPGGGITIWLFKMDDVNNQIVKIESETILTYGLNFR
ncbi:MAG: hypothetical protein H7282_01165 [Cytophagaceae bacterium]|nr:hypothetical protein [Cytophagaceae bacterium]